MARVSPHAWETFLSTLPCGCLIVTPDGVVSAANAAAMRLLGRSRQDLLSRPLLTALPSWQDSRLAQELPELILNGAGETGREFDLPCGPDRSLRAYVSRLAADQGSPQGLVVILVDRTELAKFQQQLRWTEYQASVGKLARGIAHELNNPLDGVLRYTQLALEQLPEDALSRDYILQVKTGLDRMVRAAKAFLEFSRQATTPTLRLANLNELIEDVLLLFNHRAKFQHVRLVLQLDTTLPPVMDCGLQHAIANLLKNAFDAMPKGGTLTISSRREGEAVLLEVADTGIGIPEELQPQVFQPFFTTKTAPHGNGLGLTIAREAVDRLGGQITFESRAGLGSTFRILVPAASGALVGS